MSARVKSEAEARGKREGELRKRLRCARTVTILCDALKEYMQQEGWWW